jgi:hypothetical protein
LTEAELYARDLQQRARRRGSALEYATALAAPGLITVTAFLLIAPTLFVVGATTSQ